jgi:hypothetical protein
MDHSGTPGRFEQFDWVLVRIEQLNLFSARSTEQQSNTFAWDAREGGSLLVLQLETMMLRKNATARFTSRVW